jgi:hypothetical protein
MRRWRWGCGAMAGPMPRGDRAHDYEQQTDDPEVLDLLAGIDSVIPLSGRDGMSA